MTSVGLISDTHNFLDESVFEHFKNCDEIWHAGDFGNMALVEKLAAYKPLRGVYGNIDAADIRLRFPEKNIFTCEKVKVFMQHIGGYPGRYAPGVKKEIIAQEANVFVSGHSHILKVMYDPDLSCLHINPGAAGQQGWHKIRTLIRFAIDGTDIKNYEIVELGNK